MRDLPVLTLQVLVSRRKFVNKQYLGDTVVSKTFAALHWGYSPVIKNYIFAVRWKLAIQQRVPILSRSLTIWCHGPSCSGGPHANPGTAAT